MIRGTRRRRAGWSRPETTKRRRNRDYFERRSFDVAFRASTRRSRTGSVAALPLKETTLSSRTGEGTRCAVGLFELVCSLRSASPERRARRRRRRSVGDGLDCLLGRFRRRSWQRQRERHRRRNAAGGFYEREVTPYTLDDGTVVSAGRRATGGEQPSRSSRASSRYSKTTASSPQATRVH